MFRDTIENRRGRGEAHAMFVTLWYMSRLIVKPLTHRGGQGLASTIYKELLEINKKKKNNGK